MLDPLWWIINQRFPWNSCLSSFPSVNWKHQKVCWWGRHKLVHRHRASQICSYGSVRVLCSLASGEGLVHHPRSWTNRGSPIQQHIREFCTAWPPGRDWFIIHVPGPTGAAPSSSTSESSAPPGLRGGTGHHPCTWTNRHSHIQWHNEGQTSLIWILVPTGAGIQLSSYVPVNLSFHIWKMVRILHLI